MGERWLLTGGGGQLARALLSHWAKLGIDAEFVITARPSPAAADTRAAIDLTDIPALRRLLETVRPDRIFHCAALSRPGDAMLHPVAAWAVHRDAAACIADYAEAHDAWALHCSTDFVFDGARDGLHDESCPAAPRTLYGATKLAGEQAMLRRQGCLVARLSLMHPSPDERPPATGWGAVLQRLHAGAEVTGVTDELRTPLSFAEAAALLTRLALENRTGLVHVGGAKVLSPFALIERLRAAIGSRSAIVPVTRASLGGAIERPANVALDSRRLRGWLAERRPMPAFRAAAGRLRQANETAAHAL